MDKELFSIGEVVKITGFTYRTIRYYGELGLVDPKWSEKGNKRCYTRDDINKFHFIKRLKDLGFPLEEIKETIILRQDFKKRKYPAKSIAPYLIKMLDEQHKIAKEKAEKYAELSKLLEVMLNLAQEECLNCDKDICEGNCISKKLMKDYQMPDDKNRFQ